MPYIGNTIRAADDYRLIDDISSGFNGSETSFALQVAGSAPVPFPKSPQQVLISVNGVIQEPDPSGSSGFNLVGTNIVFSSAPTNGHAFFGIIYATADYLNAGGNFPAGSLGAPSITFIGDENTGLYRKGGGSIGFVADATEIANTDSNGLTISSGNLILPDSIIHNGDSNTKIRFPAADTVSVENGGQESLRIDSSGRLIVGAVSSNNVGNFGGAALQVEGLNAGGSAFSIIRHSADAVGSSILMGKTRGTSDGATTLVQDDDVVARIIAYGGDGGDTESALGAIQFDVDGTPGANDMPGRIVFSTTPDGSATYTERLRIAQDGTATFANNVIVNGYLEVANDNIFMQRSLTHSGDTDTKIEFPSANNFAIDTAGTTRLTIDANGESIFTNNLVAGGSHPFSVTGGDYRNISVSGTTAASSGFINLGNGAATANNGFDLGRIKFHNGATEVARITAATSSSANDDADLFFATKASTTSISTKMTILDSGLVGMGTGTAPSNQLEVKSASGNCYITAERATKAGGQVGIQIRGASGGKDWYFYQHTDEDLLRIYNGTDGNLMYMDANGLGFANGKGLTFDGSQGSGVTSSLMTDYEEGTWTPTASESGNNVALSNATGRYVKIGAQVFAYWRIDVNTTSAGGHLIMGGLPYTNSSTVPATGGTAKDYQNYDIENGPIYHVPSGQTNVQFYKNEGNNFAASNGSGKSFRACTIFSTA